MPHAPRSISDVLGRSCELRIERVFSAGAYMSVDDGGNSVLLPGSELPARAKSGDMLRVFVYLDSEDRPLATTRVPNVELDEVAFLEVTALTQFGAFVDWGLPKELLVPFAKQTRELSVGKREPIGLYLDSSGRLAGTMRIAEMLSTDGTDFELDEWVEGEAWRNDPEIGLFVIVERGFVALLPNSEPHQLTRGEAASFRVSCRFDDGKFELSLRAHAHEQLEVDAEKVLNCLVARPSLRVGDRSRPEEIRKVFGLSKKAFKRAVGTLLKREAIELDDNGWLNLPSSR
ncbi:MAG TPA: S1-like domain-containing RNA-binding protein [Polyangiaceae bacterium]|nr:S1-like domain-containing RNA-binding protein [Polyangiaceae bacterium]